MKQKKSFVRFLNLVGILVIAFSNIIPSLNLVLTVKAQSSQEVNICFVTTDNSGNILSAPPEGTTISINLFTNPEHLLEGQVNSYGTNSIPVVQTHLEKANTDLTGSGNLNAYCVQKNFSNNINHEYTYSRAQISSPLDWLEIRYNDEININYVDPDIAFPYSGEWFDNIPGNESERNMNADGHIVMTEERQSRTLIIVSQLDQNLPEYAVNFSDSLTSEGEYTLSTIPSILEPCQVPLN